MLTKFMRFARIKVQQPNKVQQIKTELNNNAVNCIITKYLTNPISGKQTSIPLMMFDDIYQNYYAGIGLKSKN
jgi:hypothetical protein